MELLDKLQNDLRAALKSGDSEVVGTIRMLQAAVQNEHIAKGKDKELTQEDVLTVLRKEAKKRREAADLYAKADRMDLAEKEEKELSLIKAYLPAELSGEEIEALVQEAVVGGEKNFGKVMGAVMGKVSGRAESARVTEAVKKALGNG
ncbi:MAG: GatB/YqeY domain-containing protein [bacterium]|nr:GatB/YqeY domain-containing protein [bacterium]